MENPGSIYVDATSAQNSIDRGMHALEQYANTANKEAGSEQYDPHDPVDDVITVFDALAIDYQLPVTTPEMTSVSSDTTNFRDKPSKTDHDWD